MLVRGLRLRDPGSPAHALFLSQLSSSTLTSDRTRQDISSKYASLIYGSTSALAVVAGAAGQYFTGAVLDANGRDFTPMFELTAAIDLLGAFAFWQWWDSERAFE